MTYVREVTKFVVRVTHFTYSPFHNVSIYYLFLSVNSIGLHSVVDTSVEFEPRLPGFESRYSLHFFHIFAIITVEIQQYCLYSDSPTLLPLMMLRPPAPSAL